MRLLADEGVDKPIVDALREAGHEVIYILETNPAAEDSFILNMANTLELILITQDKDFGELVFRLKQIHQGVILVRLNGYSPVQKAEIVVQLFQKHNEELQNAFTVIQPNVVRIRKK